MHWISPNWKRRMEWMSTTHRWIVTSKALGSVSLYLSTPVLIRYCSRLTRLGSQSRTEAASSWMKWMVCQLATGVVWELWTLSLKRAKYVLASKCSIQTTWGNKQIPVLCIANDRNAQKLKPLTSTTFSLPFHKSVTSHYDIWLNLKLEILKTAGTDDTIADSLNCFQVGYLSSTAVTALIFICAAEKNCKYKRTLSTNWSKDHSLTYDRCWTCFLPGNYPVAAWVSMREKLCEFCCFLESHSLRLSQSENEREICNHDPIRYHVENTWSIFVLSDGTRNTWREDGTILPRPFICPPVYSGECSSKISLRNTYLLAGELFENPTYTRSKHGWPWKGTETSWIDGLCSVIYIWCGSCWHLDSRV